ncbi:MAG: response regulator [Candidatus Paceibacterota bacterium]|jgi:DNA-binding response OmpR family regulator
MKHILIVEDEDFLAQVLTDNLSLEGYKVDLAVDGEEAIKKIEESQPSLILLDLLLPKKDGFQVLEELKLNPNFKLIPVIVLSNLGADTDIKRALSLGAEDYFVKSQHPIAEVVERVRKYVSGSKPKK